MQRVWQNPDFGPPPRAFVYRGVPSPSRASRRPLRSGPAAPALMLSRLPSEEVVRRATLCQFEVALSISAACSTVRRRLGAAAAVQLNVEYSTFSFFFEPKMQLRL